MVELRTHRVSWLGISNRREGTTPVEDVTALDISALSLEMVGLHSGK